MVQLWKKETVTLPTLSLSVPLASVVTIKTPGWIDSDKINKKRRPRRERGAREIAKNLRNVISVSVRRSGSDNRFSSRCINIVHIGCNCCWVIASDPSTNRQQFA